MSRLRLAFAAVAACALLSGAAFAAPVTGIYTSTDLGGQLLTGRASTWRPGVNSGLPHVLHAQSWNGSALGGQWEINCAIENTPFIVQDNRVGGTGTVVYTSKFNGGTFSFFAGGWPWGDGTGTLGLTTIITTVQYVANNPVASVINGNTSGVFAGGCALTFAIANGNGVGETPFASKPATYPSFTAGSCSPAATTVQYGTWGNVITITMMVDCATPSRSSTWGALKTIYR